MSLISLFWAMEAAYLAHCLDEAFLGRGFVQMVKRRFWPEYSKKKFFWFNLGLHSVNIAAISAFGAYRGAWIIAPLALSWLFATNGLWHLFGALAFREYSPGLATSPLYWLILYFIIRRAVLSGNIPFSFLIVSAAAGAGLTILMIGSLFVRRRMGYNKN